MSRVISQARSASTLPILAFPKKRSKTAPLSESDALCGRPNPESLRSAVLNSLPEAVLIVDPKLGTILDANSAAGRWLGHPVERLLGERVFDVFPELIADDLKGRVGRQMNRDRDTPDSLVVRGVSIAGRVVDVRCSSMAHEGRKLALVLFRLSESDPLSQDAFRDPLTGLPDRRWFDRRMRRAFRQATVDADRGFSVLFVDIDRFKPVNDEHGHPIGDEVLRAVAQRLLRCVRPQDMVSRRGGDEFTVLLDGVSKEFTARRVAERIMRGLESPVAVGGREFTVSASVGISVWSADHSDPSELLEDADVSMYRVKKAGGQGYAYGFTRHDKFMPAR